MATKCVFQIYSHLLDICTQLVLKTAEELFVPSVHAREIYQHSCTTTTRGVIFPDFSRFPDLLSCLRIFLVTIVFLKPKNPIRKKKTNKKSRANVIIISSDCEEETNIERSWNFRPDLTSVSVCEVHIPDWFCCAQVGDREYRHICFWQHVKDGSIRSYRQGWRFVNWQGAQKPLEIFMARGGTKYWRLTSYTQ